MKVHFDDVSLYGTPKEEPLPSLPTSAEKTSSNFLKNQLQAWFQPTDNRLAMKLFGSKKALVKERIRQKTAGHWVIHPCSSFRWVDFRIHLCTFASKHKSNSSKRKSSSIFLLRDNKHSPRWQTRRLHKEIPCINKFDVCPKIWVNAFLFSPFYISFIFAAPEWATFVMSRRDAGVFAKLITLDIYCYLIDEARESSRNIYFDFLPRPARRGKWKFICSRIQIKGRRRKE